MIIRKGYGLFYHQNVLEGNQSYESINFFVLFLGDYSTKESEIYHQKFVISYLSLFFMI